MSKADEMFDDLGFVNKDEDRCTVSYGKGDKHHSIVTFWKTDDYAEKHTYTSYRHDDDLPITVPLHLAIHEKMKELGWLDE